MTEFWKEFREHWAILMIAVLLTFFAFGIPNYAMQFIYGGAAEEFGWSRSQVTALASVKYLTGAIVGLAVGRLLDVYNPRRVVMFAAVIGGVAMMMFFVATRLSIYYFAGVALGLSASGITVSMKVVISNVYERAQGTAIGIVLTGTSIGGVIAPIIIAPLIDHFGWRLGMLLLSAGIWLIAIPAWLCVFRGKTAANSQPVRHAVHTRPASIWNHFKLLSRDRHFWMIAIGVFLVGATDMGMLQHHVLFLQLDKGLNIETVAWATALLAAISGTAKIGFGWFYDRFSIRGIVVCYVLVALSILMAFPVTGVMTMVLFMVVRGFAHGGFLVDVPVLTKHYYGKENLGLNMGILSAFLQLGMAVGPPALGAAHDLQGSYAGGFVVASGLTLLAAVLLAPVKPRFWSRAARAESAGKTVLSGDPAPARTPLAQPE
jgi:MFS family permease